MVSEKTIGCKMHFLITYLPPASVGDIINRNYYFSQVENYSGDLLMDHLYYGSKKSFYDCRYLDIKLGEGENFEKHVTCCM